MVQPVVVPGRCQRHVLRIRLDRLGTPADTRQSGCPCLRWILRIGLHPHRSRKTSQTVDCRIPFVNKRSARFPRSPAGGPRVRQRERQPGGARNALIPAPLGHRLPGSQPSSSWSIAREHGHEQPPIAAPRVRPGGGAAAKPIPHHAETDTTRARSGTIGQVSGR